MLQAKPNIIPPFAISIDLYASEMKKAYQGNLLNSQVDPKWLQKNYTHANYQEIPQQASNHSA